jgi:hypothetical protein
MPAAYVLVNTEIELEKDVFNAFEKINGMEKFTTYRASTT